MVPILFFSSTAGVCVMEWWNAELLSLGFGFVSDDGGIRPPDLFRLSVLLDFVMAVAPAFRTFDSRIAGFLFPPDAYLAPRLFWCSAMMAGRPPGRGERRALWRRALT